MAGFLLPATVMLSTHHSPAAHTAPAPVIRLETERASVPGTYTVASGDTLSSIAARFYGHADRWPALWFTNRREVRNPNYLVIGTRLSLTRWHPRSAALYARAIAAVPQAAAPHHPSGHVVTIASARHDPYDGHHGPCGDGDGDGFDMACPGSAGAANPAPVAAPAGAVPGASGYQACVIAHESGGNPAAVNPSSGAGGLYQFLPSTWASLGYSGLPQNAPVSEQNAAFWKLYAQAGRSPWITDGC